MMEATTNNDLTATKGQCGDSICVDLLTDTSPSQKGVFYYHHNLFA